MSCVEKLPHSCGTSDALQVFYSKKEGYSGFCFKCNTYVPNPYGEDKPGPPTEKRESNIEDFFSLPQLPIEHRGLSHEASEYFEVRTALSEENGVEPEAFFFPFTKDGRISAYKIKFKDKKQFIVGDFKDVEPFGWKQAKSSGRKKLFITEGEEDSMAVFDILKQTSKPEYAHINPAVCSITSGASSAVKCLTPLLPMMKELFEEVVLCFDNDEAGIAARNEVMKIAPWVKYVELPEKDANECLNKGRIKATSQALLFSSVSAPKNTRLVNMNSLLDEAKKPVPMGMSWPFPSLTAATRGIRRGEVYYFGAGVKMGKSELVDSIGSHLMLKHNLPVLFIKPEQPMKESTQRILGKAVGKIFHDPDIAFDEGAFDRAVNLIGDKAILLDNYQLLEWDTVKTDIQIAAKDGIKDIIIDPITCFTLGLTDADANVELRRIAGEIALMAKDLDFTAYFFCHLNSPKTGDPHEFGGKVFSHQFTGSRAMMRSCHLMVGLEGNKDPELPEEQKNIRFLSVLENRMFGNTIKFPVFWDKNTGLFKEIGL